MLLFDVQVCCPFHCCERCTHMCAVSAQPSLQSYLVCDAVLVILASDQLHLKMPVHHCVHTGGCYAGQASKGLVQLACCNLAHGSCISLVVVCRLTGTFIHTAAEMVLLSAAAAVLATLATAKPMHHVQPSLIIVACCCATLPLGQPAW